ncbi:MULTISPECIES: ATP-binding protein [Streptomyces]|uniref:ATP-binding protein n=1 Tax=Streptomyces TaxID=1883 RepID=UPI00198F21F6|nr:MULTISPECIES: ATP-binding protein [Streptomyces]GGS99851.1 biotin transporter BioY [Streptomyces toxytricini]
MDATPDTAEPRPRPGPAVPEQSRLTRRAGPRPAAAAAAAARHQAAPGAAAAVAAPPYGYGAPGSGDSAATGAAGGAGPVRPVVGELRLSAFGPHRGLALPLAPVTLLTGPSGSGKSHVLAAHESLAALAAGAGLDEAFPDPSALVPDRAPADALGRRGFRIGCTVDGPAGPVRLDLAVQAEPSLRIVGERLTADGEILLGTALRDPGRRSVQAAWLTGGTAAVTRAPFPDDRLGTALIPLRVAGATPGQRRVLAAAEQVVVALRSAFACDPEPHRMRRPAPHGEGRLLRDCANLADVLRRTRHECTTRHSLLARAAQAACAGRIHGLDVLTSRDEPGPVTAVLDRGPGRPATELGRLGAGELRFLALALVLLTGPGVLAMDPAAELLSARQALTVLADGFDRGLDRRQNAELLRLALLAAGRGHVRLLAAVGEDTAAAARKAPGAAVVDLGHDRHARDEQRTAHDR